jgi:uncharacterized membrane protein
MSILITGILLFFLVHFVPFLPSLRARLIARWGEGAYKGVFALGSAVGLAFMIWGYWVSRAVSLASDVMYWLPGWLLAGSVRLVLLPFPTLCVEPATCLTAHAVHPRMIPVCNRHDVLDA